MYIPPPKFHRALAACLVLLVLAVLFSCSGGKQPEQQAPDTTPAKIESGPLDSPGDPGQVAFEEPNPPAHAELPQVQPVIAPPEKEKPVPSLPRVAIIIDDMGHHKKIGNQLLALDLNLTYSFLPYAPFSTAQELDAYAKGRDILVHIPMEPTNPAWNPGDGALYIKYDPQTLTRKTQEVITRLPHATGANNHMGSRFTEDTKAMEAVLGVLKENDFFFIDSFTTAKSKGLDLAQEMGIPTTRRHVFLDNVRTPEKVCEQIMKLVALARERGWAVGIGHPNRATLDALTLCRKGLLADVEIVGVSQLVRTR